MGRADAETLNSRKHEEIKESLILEAVELVEAGLSFREAAKCAEQNQFIKTNQRISVNHNTVRNRVQKLRKTRKEARFEQAHFTSGQEREIVSHATEMADRGFPLTPKVVTEIANYVLRSQDPDFPGVGKNWAERFIERNHDVLSKYWSTTLESVRGKAVNPNNLQKFFDILESEFDKHQFKPENIHGADETGLMSGVAQKERVIGGKGKRTQHQKREVNRENTTVIATICADGTALAPIVIFKGQHFMVKWLQDNPLNASYGFILLL